MLIRQPVDSISRSPNQVRGDVASQFERLPCRQAGAE